MRRKDILAFIERENRANPDNTYSLAARVRAFVAEGRQDEISGELPVAGQIAVLRAARGGKCDVLFNAACRGELRRLCDHMLRDPDYAVDICEAIEEPPHRDYVFGERRMAEMKKYRERLERHPNKAELIGAIFALNLRAIADEEDRTPVTDQELEEL